MEPTVNPAPIVYERHRRNAVLCFTFGKLDPADPSLAKWLETGDRDDLPLAYYNVFDRIVATAKALAVAEAYPDYESGTFEERTARLTHAQAAIDSATLRLMAEQERARKDSAE